MLSLFKNSKLLFLLGLILCVPIILSYFHSGYFPTHDGEWAVVRAGEMFREIRDHQFPPRYSGVLNFGYGYPLFNFAYPLPYYLATFLHFFKFGFIESIKVIFASSVFLSFAGMFLLTKYFWKSSLSGFVSGVLYIYLPYRLVDLYVRGSIGESLAFAIYPFLMLSALLILDGKKKTLGIFSVSLLFASIILTHNISAVYIGIIFLVYIFALLVSNKRREAVNMFGAMMWGVLASSFFSIPALFEKNQIKLSIIPIADRKLYYVTLQKLLYSPWGYGTPTDKNPFTYQLGIPQILGFISSLILFKKEKNIFERNLVVFFIILSAIFIFMMFPASALIWKLPLLSEINYPWTLLLPIGFLLTFLSGGIAKLGSGKYLGLIFAALSVILYVSFAKPESFNTRNDVYYLTNEATTTSSNELMPLWVKNEPSHRFADKVENIKSDNLIYTSNKISFTVALDHEKNVQINQIYYPGWKGYVDGKEVKISYVNKAGLMEVSVLKGAHSIELKFGETTLRLLFDLISALTIIALVFFGLTLLPMKRYGKKK